MTEPVPTPKSGIRWSVWIVLLAIVCVIVAVALSSYGDYRQRAQAAEAIALLAGAKTPLAEYFETHKKWPAKLEQVTDELSGKFTRSVAISKGADGTGEIELTAALRSEGVDRRVAGTTILLVSADGGKTWACRTGTILAKNVSAGCRN